MLFRRIRFKSHTTFAPSKRIGENKLIFKQLHIMNNLRNKVQLIGHLGTAPEIISFENGNKLAKFRMATNESYKNATGEKITDTQWHNIIAWGKQVDVFEKYLKKGQEIAVEGKLVTRSFVSKTGDKKYITEIHVNGFEFLGKKTSDNDVSSDDTKKNSNNKSK